MNVASNSRFGLSGTARISLPDPFAGPQCPTGYGRSRRKAHRAVGKGENAQNADESAQTKLGILPDVQ